MQFNDTTTMLGICQEIDSLCDSTPTSYPLSAKTRRVNQSLETLVAKIINADGTWQFDDSNFTTNPIGTGDLESGQSSYTFNDDFLDIESVKVMDANGTYILLTPFDESELGMSVEEYFGSQTGMPRYYDKLGKTIKLYPTPITGSVTLTAGLKVKFKRTGSLFTASDTTKEPGIASPWHVTIAKMSALPYCKTYKKDRVAQLDKDIDSETKEMLIHYSSREKDKRKKISNKPIRFR